MCIRDSAKDELYERLRGPAVNMKILATAFAAKKYKGSGRHEPTLMAIDFGKGRIFHSTLGHATYSCECAGFITTFLRGTEWAATSKVTIPVPDNYPTADKSSSVKFEVAPVKNAAAQPAAAGNWGHLTGQLFVKGKAPENEPEDVGNNKDKAVCLVNGKPPLDDAVVVGSVNELRDVYVMMYTGRGANVPAKFHPSYDKQKDVKITIDNVKCRFVPKAVFARPGQTLTLKNSDPVGHNCHIVTFNHEYNPNIPANKEIPLKLDNEEDKVPGKVECNIHPWMDGLILIRDNPYVSISDSTGKFEIKNLPEGEWEFQFWHKRSGYLKQLEIDGYDVNRRGVIKATIKKGETLELGKLNVPAAALEKK